MDEAELSEDKEPLAGDKKPELKQPADEKPADKAAPPVRIIVAPEDQPFTEDEIIRRKLMFDGDGGGDDRRLNILMKTFFTWYRMDPGEGEKDQLYHKMLYLMDDAQSSMQKAQLVQKMNEKELQRYESLTHELDVRIEDAKSDMNRVKEDLQQAKNVRKNRMQYDPIVGQIKQLPGRKESMDQVERMKAQAKTLQEKIQDLDDRVEKRRIQFQQLSHLAHDLHNQLNQDEALALEDLPEDAIAPEGPAAPDIPVLIDKE